MKWVLNEISKEMEKKKDKIISQWRLSYKVAEGEENQVKI